MQVYWREKPALALITFQGARVLDYRLVRLKTGANKLSIPMAVRLAPNFDLNVAVMTDARAQKAEEIDVLNDSGASIGCKTTWRRTISCFSVGSHANFIKRRARLRSSGRCKSR